jgi:hypothetical protein
MEWTKITHRNIVIIVVQKVVEWFVSVKGCYQQQNVVQQDTPLQRYYVPEKKRVFEHFKYHQNKYNKTSNYCASIYCVSPFTGAFLLLQKTGFMRNLMYSKTPIYRVPRFTGPNYLPPKLFSKISYDHWISCQSSYSTERHTRKPLPLYNYPLLIGKVLRLVSKSPVNGYPGTWYQSTMRSTGSTYTCELLCADRHLHTKRVHDHHSDS